MAIDLVRVPHILSAADLTWVDTKLAPPPPQPEAGVPPPTTVALVPGPSGVTLLLPPEPTPATTTTPPTPAPAQLKELNLAVQQKTAALKALQSLETANQDPLLLQMLQQQLVTLKSKLGGGDQGERTSAKAHKLMGILKHKKLEAEEKLLKTRNARVEAFKQAQLDLKLQLAQEKQLATTYNEQKIKLQKLIDNAPEPTNTQPPPPANTHKPNAQVNATTIEEVNPELINLVLQHTYTRATQDQTFAQADPLIQNAVQVLFSTVVTEAEHHMQATKLQQEQNAAQAQTGVDQAAQAAAAAAQSTATDAPMGQANEGKRTAGTDVDDLAAMTELAAEIDLTFPSDWQQVSGAQVHENDDGL